MNTRKSKRPLMWSALAAAAVMAAPLSVSAQQETPQPGGTVNVSTIYRTLDALSWDLQTWPWKGNHDNLQIEPLIRGDLQKGPRGTNEYSFTAADYIPYDLAEGSLAESWEVLDDPRRIVFKLREDVRWQEVPGVMKSRPLVAEDVVKNFEAMWASKRHIPTYWDFVERWEAKDDHTVVAHLGSFHGNWDYRIGWGFWSSIAPPEWHALPAEKRADWRNAAGTGPYRPVEVQQGRQQVYAANKDYWDTTTINGKEYDLPLNDRVVYHIIKDEASSIAALTSGKLDIMEAMRWQFVDQIKKTAPKLIIKKNLANEGTYVALRTDKPPFDDVRVRRAMNLAVDQQAILKSLLNGDGELLNYPFSSEWSGYYQPISELSPQARAIFEYRPDEAKKLLAEAGYKKGLEFDLQVCSCSPYHMDVVPMLQAYWDRIGVKANIKTLEYGAFRSMMRNERMAEGYLMNNSSGNPIAVLRKSFLTGQTWNASMFSNPEVDKAIITAIREPDREKRDGMLRELNRSIIEDHVPHVWLPTQAYYSAWWPWVKNYHGELRTGAMQPNAIYARIWIDQEMKKKMGY